MAKPGEGHRERANFYGEGRERCRFLPLDLQLSIRVARRRNWRANICRATRGKSVRSAMRRKRKSLATLAQRMGEGLEVRVFRTPNLNDHKSQRLANTGAIGSDG